MAWIILANAVSLTRANAASPRSPSLYFGIVIGHCQDRAETSLRCWRRGSSIDSDVAARRRTDFPRPDVLDLNARDPDLNVGELSARAVDSNRPGQEARATAERANARVREEELCRPLGTCTEHMRSCSAAVIRSRQIGPHHSVNQRSGPAARGGRAATVDGSAYRTANG